MSSAEPLFLVFLVAGLTVGFGHCVGMCGPLVVSFSLSLQERSIIFSHLLYHVGRVLTYTLLGGVMGATGSFARVAAHIESIQKGAMLLAGVLVLVMGLAMTGWLPLSRIFGAYYPAAGIVNRAFAKLSKSRSSWIYLPIGLLLGLLPCGPVYTALLSAARGGMTAETSAAGMLAGMMLMLAFGVGTVPSLLLVGQLSGVGWLKIRNRLYQVGGLLMAGVGIYFLISAVRY